MAFAANQQQNETYTFSDMLKQDHKKEFIMAMLDKVNVHEEKNHRTLIKHNGIPMNKYVKGKVKTIFSIWSFKRKRYPSGLLVRHKAWLCANGGMQKRGLNFWEIYSPDVNWITVRTLLAIATIHKLPTKCINLCLPFHKPCLILMSSWSCLLAWAYQKEIQKHMF
eukprot:1144649-Ditylum_brightwellii.AAC.1